MGFATVALRPGAGLAPGYSTFSLILIVGTWMVQTIL